MAMTFGGDKNKEIIAALLKKKAERPRTPLVVPQPSSKPYFKRKGKDGFEVGMKLKF